MDFITNLLYWLSTGLMVPVIVFLLIFFIKALILGGSFYGQYMSRNKNNKMLKNELKQNNEETLKQLSSKNNKHQIFSTITFLIEEKSDQAKINHLIGEYEIIADKDLGKSKTLTKLGPMLGLMGTLIPMGPALVGLAAGDIASMANNMQVAFATTVIGIFTGAVGFITLQIKQRWYAEDMNTLEYLADKILEK